MKLFEFKFELEKMPQSLCLQAKSYSKLDMGKLWLQIVGYLASASMQFVWLSAVEILLF